MVPTEGLFVIVGTNDFLSSALIEHSKITPQTIHENQLSQITEGPFVPSAIFISLELPRQQYLLGQFQAIKTKHPTAPLIACSYKSDYDSDVSDAFSAGVDDFIRLPCAPSEVIARLQVRASELAQKYANDSSTFGDLTVDRPHRVITNKSGTQRFLTPTELNLLNCLLDAGGTVVAREYMKRKCWGQLFVSDNALNRKLHELRRAIAELSSTVEIKTQYGKGFALVVHDQKSEKKPLSNIYSAA